VGILSLLKNFIFFAGGLFLLILGADLLIQGCVKLSYAFLITPLFVGVILVALGTSLPEAGVSIVAQIKNYKEIALGNVIGSCIANIGLVLGICALLKPSKTNRKLFKNELPVMILAIIIFYLLSQDLILNRWEGLIFLLLLVIFLFFSYKGAKVTSVELNELKEFKFRRVFEQINSKFMIILLSIFSLGLVIWGANLMIKSGVFLARTFGISNWIISITVFAVGTSLPELATSLAASFKKIGSISMGNIIGSNIFNILFILGVVSLIRPIKLSPSMLKFEFPILLLFSLFLFRSKYTGYKITRWQGLILVIGYIIFIILLIVRRG